MHKSKMIFNSNNSDDLFSVLVVIVLYRMRPLESTAYRTLREAMLQLGQEASGVRIVLFDNSPGTIDQSALVDVAHYVAAPYNAGLASAYNCALRIAHQEGMPWLLTLDQDTELPSDYLLRLRAHISKLAHRFDVAAIVPRLLDGVRSLSPCIARPWGGAFLRHDFIGVNPYKTSAVNSGSLFRVSALRQIGGFNEEYWLDQLDADTFRKIHLHGKYVYIAGDIHLRHELSLLHEESINLDRYKNILLAESAFHDTNGAWLERKVLSLRLFARLMKQSTRKAPWDVLHLTASALMRRVVVSRKRRIDEWKKAALQRIRGKNRESEALPAINRLTVSVCMAAYNGELYIAEQLRSILVQLRECDEVIVVDDASTDATCDVVCMVNDRRIKLVRHMQNQGLLRTFEDAIRSASNSVLFLSDQDDTWALDKIERVRNVFAERQDVNLVVTDSSLTAKDGTVILESYLGKYGPFKPGFWANLARNRYGGHNMAFRAEIVSAFLPFHRNRRLLHDHWIGLRHSLEFGNAYYIDRPLTMSRRHDGTVTGRRRSNLLSKVHVRIFLIWELLKFQVRRWACLV